MDVQTEKRETRQQSNNYCKNQTKTIRCLSNERRETQSRVKFLDPLTTHTHTRLLVSWGLWTCSCAGPRVWFCSIEYQWRGGVLWTPECCFSLCHLSNSLEERPCYQWPHTSCNLAVSVQINYAESFVGICCVVSCCE